MHKTPAIIKIRQAFGLGRVRSSVISHLVYSLWVYPPTPIVDIWVEKVKGQNPSPAHPINSFSPGVVTAIEPFRGPPATSPIITIEFQQREQ